MDEESPASLLLKIKPWLESDGPFGQAEESTAAEEEEESFSTLDLRDRVVVMLLYSRKVRAEQVEAAWKRWKSENQDTPDALWRVVARLPDVETEAVFEEAARVYAFEPAMSILHEARSLMREHRKRFSLRQRRQLVALGILPVKVKETADGPLWVFATHDPARSSVQRLLSKVSVPAYEVRYAPATEVQEQLKAIFPGEMSLEPKASEGTARQKPERNRPTGDEEAPSFLDTLFENDEADTLVRERHSKEREPTFVRVYEELIAGVAQSRATRVRLRANDEEQLVATFDYDDRGAHRQVELQTPPGAVLSFMRRRTRSMRRSGEDDQKVVHRWVDGCRRSFCIEALPGRSDWSAGRAEIVIEAVE